MQSLIAALAALIIALAPYNTRRAKDLPPPELYDAYAASIATDIAAVVTSQPPIPGMSRTQSAVLLTSVAYHESGFLQSVDSGKRKGDNGRSWCILQLNVGTAGTVQLDGYRDLTGPDLVADRSKCLAVGYEMIRRSVASCSAQGMTGADLLSQYATGHCERDIPAAQRQWSISQNHTVRAHLKELRDGMKAALSP